MKYYKYVNCYFAMIGCSMLMLKTVPLLGICLMLISAGAGIIYFRKDKSLLAVNLFYSIINIIGIYNYI